MCLSLETLTRIIRTGYSGATDRPSELCYKFSISNDLTQMVNFPTLIPECDSDSPAFFYFFISSDASICSKMAFPQLGNFYHVVVSVFIGFPSSSKRDALFQLMTILALIGTDLVVT